VDARRLARLWLSAAFVACAAPAVAAGRQLSPSADDLFEPPGRLPVWWFLGRLAVTFLFRPLCAVPPALPAWAVSVIV